MIGAHLTPVTVQFWVLATTFALFAGTNLALIPRFLAPGRRPSMIPLLGGIAGAVAFLLRPELRGWAWVPLLADPGCGAMVIAALIGRLTRR